MTVLALKVLLAPAFIVAATLVGRRSGPRVAGVIGGLPVIAGAIILVLAVGRDIGFAEDAATGAVLAVVALIGFVLVYERVSRRFPWPIALAAGWAAFVAGTLALRHLDVGPAIALVLAWTACAVGLVLLPRPTSVELSARAHTSWDLPLRAMGAFVLVVAVTAASAALGPRFSGLLAAFPIVTSLLAVTTHATAGAREAARLLFGFTAGFLGYATFCFIVSVGLRPFGIGGAFSLAIAATIATQAAALALTRRFERSPRHPSAGLAGEARAGDDVVMDTTT